MSVSLDGAALVFVLETENDGTSAVSPPYVQKPQSAFEACHPCVGGYPAYANRVHNQGGLAVYTPILARDSGTRIFPISYAFRKPI